MRYDPTDEQEMIESVRKTILELASNYDDTIDMLETTIESLQDRVKELERELYKLHHPQTQ